MHQNLDECQDEVQDLRAAPHTRPVIDRAKGMLMAEHGCSPGEAFQMISHASQREKRKTRDIAKAVIDKAQSNSSARLAQRRCLR
ncbi:MAG TPA: ANTAR domain-containing protein [Gemmatimonadales bacterium]|nr:ANTAR domain-containing protein [Gemmatimonadales bacterium]